MMPPAHQKTIQFYDSIDIWYVRIGSNICRTVHVAAVSNGASNPLISTATKVKSDYMMDLSQLNENGIP